MVRDILDWTQNTFDNIQEETLTVVSAAKAFGCGVIEGYMNGAVVMGTIAIVGLTVMSALGKEITITDKKA
jgi:hypothetical protein